MIAGASLAACGGGNGGGAPAPAQTANGVFKDSNVSGMNYVSGGQSGVTGADGSFTYEVGQDVTFSIGGVTIGNAPGAPVVTPIDLVPGSNSSSVEVQNIVRFLMMLDNDGDPANGITISAAVRSAADNWTAVDFTAANLAAEVNSFISDAASADGMPHNLPAGGAARGHLESTLLCNRAGGYTGLFSGDDNGPFGLVVNAVTGMVTGVAFSNTDQALLLLSGSASVSFDQTGSFVSGNTTDGSTFSGSFTGQDGITGTWENTQFAETGTFDGTRIGGDTQAVYRFTGSFQGNAAGLFTFDVDASGNVTGVAYTATSIDQPGLVVDETIGLSGTVNGTVLSATSTDGDGTITGTLDRAAGTMSGNWSDQAGLAGTFSGQGCKLN